MNEKSPNSSFSDSPIQEQTPKQVREYKIREKPSLRVVAEALGAQFDQEGYTFKRGQRFLKEINGETEIVAVVTGADSFAVFKTFPELFEKALTIADFVKEA